MAVSKTADPSSNLGAPANSVKEIKMIDKNLKSWIDNASYTQLLEKWRFAPFGDPFFQGEAGDYYSEVMKNKKKEVGDAAHVTASKAIGWER